MIVQLRNLDEETYKKLWNYKVEHGLKTLAQALKEIMDKALPPVAE